MAEQQQFFSEGYIHLRGAVPAGLLGDALRHINGCIGRGEHTKDIPADPAMRGLPPQLSTVPALTALCTGEGSRLPTVLEDLLGRGNVDPGSTRHVQVALRFPSASATARTAADRSAAATRDGTAWHVDGFNEGEHSPFGLLVGVCLSDTDTDPAVLAGNLAVHPGAHWTLQAAVRDAVSTTRPGGPAAAAALAAQTGEFRKDLGPPMVLRMKRGDVVLAHQKLPHRGMPNYSPDVRVQCYFRIRHRRHTALREGWLDDLMLPFEGTKAALGQ